MSLRIKFILVIGFLFSSVAAIIWFGIRPGYEQAVIEERIKLITEYQREKVQRADQVIDNWYSSVIEIEERMIDLANIQQVQTLFEGYQALFPEFKSIRIQELSTGEFIEIRTGSDEIGRAFNEIDFEPKRFRDKNLFIHYDFNLSRFYIARNFHAFEETFRVIALFETEILEGILFSHNLGVGETEVLWKGNEYISRQVEGIPEYRPEDVALSRMQLVTIDGREHLVMSSPITTLGAIYAIYIEKSSVHAPIRRLFQNSIWLAGLSLLVLLSIIIILFRQLTQPVKQFIEDLEPLGEYNFGQPISHMTVPELRNISVKMENIRQKLEHYQRINVEQIISNQEKNQVLLKYSSDLIAVFDNTGHFSFMNNQFLELFGDLSTECPTNIDVFFNIKNLVTIREKGTEENRLEHLIVKKTESELMVTSNSQKKYFFDTHVVEIMNEQNDRMGGQLMMYDLSHEREIDKLRNEMIHTIAHELKNPLTGLMLISDALRHFDISDSERLEYYEVIETSVETMQKLIHRFLEISALESKTVDHQMQLSDLSDIVTDVAELMKPQFNEKDLTLNLTVQKGLKPVLVVPDLFTDMVRNLLSNAIKYGPSTRPIDVDLRAESNQLVFSVTDYGYGIKENDRDQIFKKFYRISEYKSEEGVGLGLPYVMEIIKKHRGSIHVESNEKIGSRFIVKIPYIDIVTENMEVNV